MHWNNDCPSRQNTAKSAPHVYKKGAGSKGKNQQQNAATKGAVHQAATSSPSDLDTPDFNVVLQTLHQLCMAKAQANLATIQAHSLVGLSLTAPISINGIKKQALFDSGSQTSICSWHFYRN
uniref:Uncharacterized protein n=1 Tax=Plectus sambesii TaxID=2011161 RepID=A0A914X3K1_9BILA